MATNKYITLSSSNGSISKRFMAIQMSPVTTKNVSIVETAGGNLDVSFGGVFDIFKYVLRVPYEVVDSQYGVYDDIKELYKLNNPNGTPSSTITLVDHYGDQYNTILVGEMVPEPLTTVIDGLYAWYMIPIELRVQP